MAEAGTTSPFNRCFIRQGRRDKRLLRRILEPPQIAELTPDEKLDQICCGSMTLKSLNPLARKYSAAGRFHFVPILLSIAGDPSASSLLC